MNRRYIVIKIDFYYTIYTNRLDITCSTKKKRGSAHRDIDKIAFLC